MKPHHPIQGWATPRGFWAKHRESTLNGLALGLLLAAWNAADRETAVGRPAHAKLSKGHKSVNEL
jgi:hypothetical protein